MRKIKSLNEEFVKEFNKRKTSISIAVGGQDVRNILNKLEFDELIQILMHRDVARRSDMHYLTILELMCRELSPIQRKAAAWFYYASPSNKRETSIIFSLKEKRAISKLLIVAKELTSKELVEIGAQ